MLALSDLRELFERLGTPSSGRKQIESARMLAPVREVRSNSGNVITRYASRKMARLIDTESRTVEFPAVIQYEHDANVLEYYAQPMQLDLLWRNPSCKGRSRVQHTPDFLLIRQDGFLVEEWREEERLLRLSTQYPGRFVKETDGWHYPAAEEALREMGIDYRLRSAQEHPRVFVQNLVFLSNFLDPAYPPLETSRLEELRAQIGDQCAIPLLHLLHRGRSAGDEGTLEVNFTTDDVYKAIADRDLVFDLRNDLLSDTHRVMVFRDQAAMLLSQSFGGDPAEEPGGLSTRRDVSITTGVKVDWDGRTYTIVRDGRESVTLQDERRSFEVEIATLTSLHLSHKVQIHGQEASRSDPNPTFLGLSPKEIDEVLERAKWVERARLNSESVPRSARTLRRYRAMMRKAGSSVGEQKLALVSRISSRGNRTRRLPKRLFELIALVAHDEFNTADNITKKAAYKYFVHACEEEKVHPCSFRAFSKEIEALRSVRAQKGKRIAYQEGPIVWYLGLTEAIHGVRPFQYVHIDHTQLDLLLVSAETRKVLGKPWLTLAIDAESRNIVGFFLSFEPPSYRSCMMVLRDLVRRHHRIPDMLVLDNGKEFHSQDLARLCELYGCSLRYRPSGQPRHGAVVERAFGITNTDFIHLLEGNTKLLKNPRSLTKSVLPENFAAWTLAQLHGALDFYFFQLYGMTEHPAHGAAPVTHFKERMEETGERKNRLVRYDETFLIETCPSPEDRSTRVVDPKRGIKVNNLMFWNNLLNQPELRKQELEVRLDPWDPGTIYALINNRWVPCHSKVRPHLNGYTEVERKYLFAELKKKSGGRSQAMTPHLLTEWLQVLKPENFNTLLFERQTEGRVLYSHLGMASVSEQIVGAKGMVDAKLPLVTPQLKGALAATQEHTEFPVVSHEQAPIEDSDDDYSLF